MARTKQAEAAEKKAAAAKKAEEEKLAAEEQAAAADEKAVKAESAAEGEDVEMQEAAAATEGDEDADAEDEKKRQRPPLTEEDHAFIAEALKTKVKLSDESESDLFSYGPPKFDSPNPFLRPIICHLCRIANLQRPEGLKSHMNGKRHMDKLKRKVINAQKFLEPYLLFYKRDGEQVKQFKIFPGENIPEVNAEYESRIVDKVEWEFKKIDDEKLLKTLSEDPVQEYNKTKPVIGLDYILKMKHRESVKCYCVLCDIYAQPGVYQHVTDAKHQATYIIKHFPTLYEKVVKGLKIPDDNGKETALRNIFRKLYRKIEIKHGFKLMQVVDAPDFHSFRARYINKIRKAPHYDEKTLEFTDAEVNVLIKKSNSNIRFNQPDPVMISGIAPVGGPSVVAARKRGAPAVESTEAPIAKNRRPNNESDIEKWSKYRVIMPKRLAKLAAQYKKYEQDPKHHPRYQEEWSQFWHARCAQLKKDNIDPDNYNFDKEWLPFWEKRLRKLYHKDVADRKSSLRLSFGLPNGRRTPSPSAPMRNVRQPNQIRPLPIASNFVPNMNNFVPNNNNNSSFGRGGDQGNRRNQRFAQQRMEQQQQQQQQQPRNRPAPPMRVTREPVSIISVLRLLTALEDQLGSLGPRSVQLLSKAVLCEKNNQNTNDLLTDNDYYVLFATAKEKLKGQIMANVIDNSKVRAVNVAIGDLSTILGIIEKATRSRGPNQQGGRGNGNNSFGGGNNFGRNNTGFGSNANNANDNFGGANNNGDSSFRNDDNFGNNGVGSGNYRSNDTVGNNLRGSSDGGNYRNNSNNDGGNYRGGFNNDGGNYRNNSNSNDGNYRGSNDGGNYRNNSNDGGNYRGTNNNANNDSGNYRGGNNNDVANYRGGNNDSGFNRGGNNDSGFNRGSGGGGGNNDGGNYRNNSNNDSGNFRSSDVGNYRNNDGGSNFASGNNASNYRSNDGGNTFSTTTSSFGVGSNSGSGFATNNSSSSQYRSVGNTDNFNSKSSNFGGNNTSNQRGNWMGGGGSVYSSLNNKSNSNTPAFSSGIGGISSQPQPLMSFDRNTSSNFGFGSGGSNNRRFN